MHRIKATGAIAVLALALAACGGGGSGAGGGGAYNPPAPVAMPSSPATAPSSAPSAGANTATGFSGDVKQAQVNGRTILVDASTGLALYFFNGDSTNQSNCTGSCLTIWPAHKASAKEKASGNFSIFTRSDGLGQQWAYKGRPLYTFVSDTANANATGNGIQNFVLATP